MKFVPHAYQEYARDWIIQKPTSALFLDMGLGKTVCTLAALKELMHDYFDVARVLVIAPLRVARDTWISEKDKWDELKYLKISKVVGSARVRVAALDERADIYVINRENLVWLVDHLGSSWCFDMVVIDELSSFKSYRSQRFRALKRVRKYIKRIVGLTGTPAPNGLLDLWPQIYLLDGGLRLEGSFREYRNKYFEPLGRKGAFIYSWRLKAGAKERIFDSLKDICTSMKAEDYLRLPKKINNFIEVELPKASMHKYLKLEEEMAVSVGDSSIKASSAGALAGKLLQMANGAVYDENHMVSVIHDAKLGGLDEVIEGANGRPVLVFYNYRHDLERLLKHLEFKGARVLKTSQDIEDWNRGEVPIMLVHPASAGHGLNLQFGGSTIVWFGLNWSLELYQQANARLYRQGQVEHVIVHHIIAKGTIDEDVMRVLQKKEVRQEDLLEAVRARLKRRNSWWVG